MNLSASIVDTQLQGIVERAGDRLKGDENRKRSAAFVALCVKAVLALDETEALERVTDGGGDAGIDAIDLGDIVEGEITVTVFQGKYKQRNDGNFAFPANEIGKLASSVAALFDPNLPPFEGDLRLKTRVEEVRSLVREGVYPTVRVILCSNGRTWDANGQRELDRVSGQVTWEHLDVDRLVLLLQPQRAVDDMLRLSGRALDENLGVRVLVGRMAVTEIAALFERHGDRLLDQNIRRFLGAKNRVNRQIEDTLKDPGRRVNFYAFNNGVTMVCRQFRFNALQAENQVVPVKDLRIVNGGQTCWTIHRLVGAHPEQDWSTAQVLVRVYEVGEDDDALVQAITVATNSQSPVEVVDLHANDPIQIKLEQGLKDLGYTYLRKRGQRANGLPTITPEQAAAAVLAVWRGKPHLARFATRQHFGRLYDEIFDENLLPVQVVAAANLVGVMEHITSALPELKPYRRFHEAYLAGKLLFPAPPSHPKDLEVLDSDARTLAFETAHARINLAMLRDGINRESLQAHSAYFRRPDTVGDPEELAAWVDNLKIRFEAVGIDSSDLKEVVLAARLRD